MMTMNKDNLNGALEFPGLPVALVVEDDPDLTEIFQMALEAAGFEAILIADGREAINRLPSISPKLIVLDLHLPRASGAEILDAIRASEHLREARVIVASANPRWADELRSKVDLVLDKPVSYRQLRDFAARFNS